MRIRQQEGWALLTAMVMLTLMLSIGLATFAYVDGQTTASTKERTRDSSFNLDEGVLDQQAYLLGKYFPASAGVAYPDCSWGTGNASATATGGFPLVSPCLVPGQISAVFNNKDYASGVTWNTRVRDNQGSQSCVFGGGSNCSYFYDDTSPTVQAYPGCTAAVSCYSYDANGDNEVWVRSTAVVQGKKHTLIELVRADKHQVPMPNTVLTANSAHWQNKHGTVITDGSAVNFRCAPGCVDTSHIDPPGAVVFNYAGQTTMKPSDVSALVARAIQENAYYTSCPTNPNQLLVVVNIPSGSSCTDSALPVTSPSRFATYVQLNGSLITHGTFTYYGLIYLANGQVPGYQNGSPVTGDVFSDNGNADVIGSIVADGPGSVKLGNGAHSGLSFDSRAFNALWSYGNRNVVKGTFREING
jgi:hypothetical protein